MKKLRVNISEKSYWLSVDFHLFILSREELVGSRNHDFTKPSEDYVLFLVPSLQVETLTERIQSWVALAIIISDAGDAIAQE